MKLTLTYGVYLTTCAFTRQLRRMPVWIELFSQARGFLRIHIKTANISEGGHVFTLWTTNVWRVRQGMDRCKEQSSEADYFACVGIFKSKMPEVIWWLPYDSYKDKRSVSLHSGMTELLRPPAGLLSEVLANA